MKIIAFTLLVAALSAQAFGQIKNNDRLKFGFNVGINYSNLQIQKAVFTNAEDIRVSNNMGGRMGIFSDYQLTNHISVSPKAEMSFNQGKVSILKAGDQKKTYEVLPVTIELASHFNYKFKAGAEWTTPYILFGPSLKIPILDKKNPALEMTRSSDMAFDLGIGFDKILPSFHFAPELRYSYGLMNLNSLDELSKLNFHSVSLIFNFKG